jgi:phage terminase large subunit
MKSSDASSTLEIPTPRAFLPLLRPARYKGIKGGRGSGKSHFWGEYTLERILRGHTRAACVREIQNSIADSVKRLIEDKIRLHSLDPLFKITDKEIVGPHDSLVIFKGLQNHTAASAKSLEGFNLCWVEEAQTISQRSLDTLTPTFRTPGTELLFGWNSKLPTDPVDKLFLENEGDPDFILVHANYDSNPWFPADLRKDMERDKRRDPDKYAHVWLGEYERNSEARVFRNWRVEAFETPAGVRPYYGADWGFSVDPTVLVRCFFKDRTLYVDQELYQVGLEIDRTPEFFRKMDGATKWPIRADSARPETISYMNRHGFPKLVAALKGQGSVEDGIEFIKSFDVVVHPRCKHTADELARYAYKTDKLTGEILPVLDDKHNHVIDALRYAVEGIRNAPHALRVQELSF